jgi:hypothetical protein
MHLLKIIVGIPSKNLKHISISNRFASLLKKVLKRKIFYKEILYFRRDKFYFFTLLYANVGCYSSFVCSKINVCYNNIK